MQLKSYQYRLLPTAALPKAMLLFSHLLPAVKLLLKIPPCTAALAHPSHPLAQHSIMGRWLQQTPLLPVQA